MACDRLRSALSWPVDATSGLVEEGVSAHHRSLRRHGHGVRSRARSRASRHTRMLYGRRRRARAGAQVCCRVRGCHRAGGGKQDRRALYRLVRHARRERLGDDSDMDLRSDGAPESGSFQAGRVVDLRLRAAPASTGETPTSTASTGICAVAREQIDTSKCPVYLLTGEYDYACAPEETDSTAAAIPGAHSTMMEGIGHFPMTENYPLFRRYLLPILRDILPEEGT